jgi:hypothetical protein
MIFSATNSKNSPQQGIPTEGGRLNTVDLLIKVACFVKKENDIFNKKELI